MPWLVSQSIAGFVSLCLMMYSLNIKELSINFLLIPLIVNGIGDGLAEPIGIRFGKYRYKARALWYEGRLCSGTFHRTLEGSACVFFSGVLSVSVLYNEWQTKTRFLVALFSVPIGMTAAEAFAPHTWDTPFLFLVGAALVWFLFDCVPDNFNFPYM